MNDFLKTFHSLLTYSSCIRGDSLSPTCVNGCQGPGSLSEWGFPAYVGRAARTYPPLSVNLGRSRGYLQAVWRGRTVVATLQFLFMFLESVKAGPWGQAGPGFVDGALCCVPLGMVLVVELMPSVLWIS